MKFRFFFLLIVALIFTTIHLFAQDDELDNLDFEMQDYEQFEEEATPYFVIGGGAVLNLLLLDYKDINDLIKTNGFDLGDTTFQMEGIMYQFGAQGIITIGVIPNVRIGVIGMGGSTSPENTINDTIDGVIATRNFKYDVGYTGINIDYAIVPFSNFKFAIVPGVTLGWGSMKLESYQTESKINWTEFKPGADDINFQQTIETTYWHISPMLSFEYAPTFLSMFRASIGYSMSLGSNWYLNGNPDSEVMEVPDGINSNGLTVQFAILLGIFNY